MSQRKQTNRNFVASKARDESAREGPADCSRRDCIKRSALALAGMALASHSAIAVTTAPKKIRMGVIGGGFGASFYWHKHPDCIVEAVSDLREDRRRLLMKTYNCPKAYNSLEELVLDKNIDAVAIFTDGPLHVQHAIEAMKNGKHVISAVPACWGTVEQAEMLLDAVKKYGLTYMMAETSYYYPFAISVRKYYEQGQFGEIFDSESDYLHDGLESLYFHNGKRTWRYGVAPMHYQPVAKVGRSHTADIKWRYVYGKETVSGTATADVGGDGETASKSGTSLLRAVEPGAGESRV